tara:strand:+ start:1021 stop:2103 length:1083 start_codon:yes stop_codon:yes gene_type:complete
MLDTLTKLFENNVVSEELRKEIEEAWQAKVIENQQKVTVQLREEFAQKYEHDKSVMVEAIDNMVNDRLTAEMQELAEDRKQLIEAKAKYGIAMRENANLLKQFVFENLNTEVKELHEDQKTIANKFQMLEEFIVDNLAKEITEFQTDKNDLAETKVRLVREAKSHFNKVKTQFVENSANKVSAIVEKILTQEIKQLKEDIDSARKNDFGRRLFESFAAEYSNSYLNEKTETAKLLKIVDLKNKQLSEAKKIVQKHKELVANKDVEIKQISESANRQHVINELVNPLNKEQKEVMLDLLESVQTDRLKKSFDKYLPTVIENNTQPKKAVLTEGKEVTGNKEEKNIKASDNVIDIRRLAGIK